MLMKNNKKKILYLILIFFYFSQNLIADEFDITASNIQLLEDNKKILAEGNVIIRGQDGIVVEAESATYDKSKNVINAKKSVKVLNSKTKDILTSDKIHYLQIQKKIIAEGNVIFKGNNGITIMTETASYDNKNQIIKSNQLTKMNDKSGNSILMDMFNYSIKNKNLRSKGNIEITDKEKNKYYFDDIFVEVEKKRMAGSNVKIKFNKNIFGNIENDPRLVGTSAVITENKSYIDNGVFTTCKKRGDKCPPWKMSAKKVVHDKNL